jgi:hypothetical protein
VLEFVVMRTMDVKTTFRHIRLLVFLDSEQN